jgi:hypothetical protein
MKKIAIVCAAAIVCVPAIYGLGHMKGTGLCNAPNVTHALGDASQSMIMNMPAVGAVYRRGVKSGIESNCTPTQLVALTFTGQGKLLNLETPAALID